MNRIASGILRRLSQFLLVIELLHLVAYVRFVYFRYVRRKMLVATDVSEGVAENTRMHNLQGMRRSVTRVARSNVLIRPLSMIHRVHRNIANFEVLSIGPRSEAELLSLMAHGFRWRNIRGVDLMSYSPRIDLGDMHELQYPDGSFDIIVASRVLGYSNTPRIAAAEIVRVVRDRGLIAVNSGDIQPDRNASPAKDYRPGADTKFSSLGGLLDIFAPYVDQIYFQNDPSQETESHRGPILAIFSVKKHPL